MKPTPMSWHESRLKLVFAWPKTPFNVSTTSQPCYIGDHNLTSVLMGTNHIHTNAMLTLEAAPVSINLTLR
jgi:hypothetical protein